MRKRALRVMLVAVGAVMLLTVGCTVKNPVSPSQQTLPSAESTSTESQPAVESGIGYYLVGEKVAPVRLPDVAAGSPDQAVAALVAGVPADPAGPAVTTAIPSGTRVRDLTVADGKATIDLSADFASGGGSLSMMARVAQVVFTLTRFSDIDRVVFEMEGEPVEALGGEGLILTEPQTRETYEDLSPEVLIETPVWGDEVGTPVTVSGTANVFEARFSLEVLDEKGRAVGSADVQATSGTGTRGTFEAKLDTGAVTGPVTIEAVYGSPKDGSRTVAGSVRVTVR